MADQWSFIEVIEMLTAARERLFLAEGLPMEAAHLAVAHPTRSLTVIFHRPLYLFDQYEITTRLMFDAGDRAAPIFRYDIVDSAHGADCVAAWELLEPIEMAAHADYERAGYDMVRPWGRRDGATGHRLDPRCAKLDPQGVHGHAAVRVWTAR